MNIARLVASDKIVSTILIPDFDMEVQFPFMAVNIHFVRWESISENVPELNAPTTLPGCHIIIHESCHTSRKLPKAPVNLNGTVT